MNYVLVKASAAVAIAPLSFDVVRHKVEPVIDRLSSAGLVGGFALTRLAAVVIAFVVAGLDYPGDIERYYQPFGMAAASGGRLAQSPYNPGFDFLIGFLLQLFRSPLAILLAMTLAEIGAFGLMTGALRQSGNRWTSSIVWLWTVTPLSILNVALNGQDEALILLVWSAAFVAVMKNRAVLAGVLGGLGIMMTKVLALLALLPVFAAAGPKSVRTIASAIVVTTVAVLLSLRYHVPLLGFLHETRMATPGNIWTWCALLADRVAEPRSWQFLIAAIVIGGGVVWVRRRPIVHIDSQILRLTGTLGALFLALSPKSFTAYSVMFLPGILFIALQTRQFARALLLGVVVPVLVLEPSLWFQLGGPARVPNDVARLTMLATDAVLLLGYAAIAWRGLTLHKTPESLGLATA